MFANQPKRHPACDKLRCFYSPTFRGFEVQQQPGWPLIEQYLERTYNTIDHALHQNNRTLTVRIDLRFPTYMPVGQIHNDNQVLSRFFRYLQHELDSAGTKYRSVLRYVWAREQMNSLKPHYHLLLLLNYDAFNSLGNFRASDNDGYDGNNLYHRIVRSWSRALGWPLNEMQGVVHVCGDLVTGQPFRHCLHRHDQIGKEEVMYAASYLCKAYSKPIGQKVHVFGTSRV